MAQFKIKKTTSVAPPISGEPHNLILWQEEGEEFRSIYAGKADGEVVKFSDSRFAKAVSFIDPVASDRAFIYYVPESLYITELRYVVRGGTNITFSIYKTTTVGGVGTLVGSSSTVSGIGTTTISSTSVLKDDILYVTIGSVTGAVDELFVQVTTSYL